MAEGIIWLLPLCLLLTAITSSGPGDRLVAVWAALFALWGIGWPVYVIYSYHFG